MIFEDTVLEAVKGKVNKLIAGSDEKYKYMYSHLKWVVGVAEFLCQEILKDFRYKEKPDPFVVRLSAWSHDTGVLIAGHQNHEIYSEKYVRDLLLNNFAVPKDIVEKVAHAVRAHRNRDVKPSTIEAKILCVADSAAHLLNKAYIELINQKTPKEYLEEKLTRDMEDIKKFPFLKEKLEKLHVAWKMVVDTYPYDLLEYVEADPGIYEGEPSERE